MTWFIKKLGVTLCLVFSLAASVNGAIIMDQESYGDLGGGFMWSAVGIYREDHDVHKAQTFTVGIDGLLAGIDIRVFCGSGNNPLEVHILPTTDYTNEPVYDFAESLGMVTIPANDLPRRPVFNGEEYQSPMVYVDLRDKGIYVSEGDLLAIGLKGTNSEYGWIMGSSGSIINTYPRGKCFGTYDTPYPQKNVWHGSAYDAQFRTYVQEVPEPNSIGLIVSLGSMLCLGATSSRYRCRKKAPLQK